MAKFIKFNLPLCWDLACVVLTILSGNYLGHLNQSNVFVFFNNALPIQLANVLLLSIAIIHSKISYTFWKFFSIRDLLSILRLTCFSQIVFSVLNFAYSGYVPLFDVIYTMLILNLSINIPRLAVRIFTERKISSSIKEATLIVGAGYGGEHIVRDLLRNQSALTPIGFVDDDPHKLNKRIHQVPVLGTIEDIPRLVLTEKITQVIIAIPTINTSNIKRIIAICKKANVAYKTLPAVSELPNELITYQKLREVSIEDLLCREPVKINWELLHQHFTHKIVMVSGAGGSIGSELSRQLARLNLKKLILVDHSEYFLYQIEQELLNSACHIVPLLCDVSDDDSISNVFTLHQPHIVIHAAAYKHVPLLESQARTAVKNNILGTWNMLTLAAQNHTQQFMLVSTDKAVNPANVMGKTKKIAELLTLSFSSQIKTSIVRFGNVLGSNGSVLPLFQKQLKETGVITVTHPEMTRYFMTIPEASQLIMQAASMSQGGKIFVLDMGTPVNITYLATQLIVLSGRELNVDAKICYTGLRPGEKLHEELFTSTETVSPTSHPKIMSANSNSPTLLQCQTFINQLRVILKQQNEKLIFGFVDEFTSHHTLIQTSSINLEKLHH